MAWRPQFQVHVAQDNDVIYLNQAELEVLTGYKRAADQVRWLEENGVPHTVNAQGKPVVRKDMEKMTVSAPELGPVP